MLFKKAYARGCLDALLAAGVVKLASEEEADAVASEAAQTLPNEPTEAVSPDVTTQLATNLVQLSDALQAGADSAAEAAQVAAKTGSTEEENTPESAAKDTEEQEEENAKRPAGYANVGVAGVGTQEQSGQGAIGQEMPNPPANGVVGENSAVDAVKGASVVSIRERIKKAMAKKQAGSSTITGDKPAQENTQGNAAKITGEAAMEAANRPEGYAVKGEDNPGASDMAAPARAAAVGKEEPHPKAEGTAAGSSNTVVEQSKSAEEDEIYRLGFQHVANKYAAFLPKTLSQDEKVAALQGMLGMIPAQRDEAAVYMAKTAELPPGLAAFVAGGKKDEEKGESKEEEKKEEKDEKKDEKKDEEKKAAAQQPDLLTRLRKLSK